MRLPDRDSPLLDAFAAVLILVGGTIDVLTIDHREGPLWANLAAMAVLGALALWRRRHPVLGGYGFLALVLVLSAALTPPPELVAPFAGLLLFPYTAGSRMRGRASHLYLPCFVAVVTLANVAADQSVPANWVFPCILGLAAYLAGRNVVHRSALAVEMHEAALRADEEREAEMRRAVAAERRRIAHEMHDVVAHSISVMVVQAGGARRILDRDPGRAQEAAAQIERTGRETLLEMRRLLGVMRRPGQDAELTPHPTLDGLPDLVARARERGLDVELRLEGRRRTLAAGLELGAYRVVQHALDDVLRVAPGAHASVCVCWGTAALELTITDDRPGVPFAEGAGPSLIGVRERVALYGGQLRSGQRTDGGHEVSVRLPFDPPVTPPDSDPVPAQGAA